MLILYIYIYILKNQFISKKKKNGVVKKYICIICFYFLQYFLSSKIKLNKKKSSHNVSLML